MTLAYVLKRLLIAFEEWKKIEQEKEDKHTQEEAGLETST